MSQYVTTVMRLQNTQLCLPGHAQLESNNIFSPNL